MRASIRFLPLVAVVVLACTASATATSAVVPGGTYTGKSLKGASFKIAPSGTSASFHGMVDVGLLCGAKTTTRAPHAGQSVAVIVLDPSAAPTIKINNANGTFSGTRHYHGDIVTIVGRFSANAKTMVFTVKTSGMCASSKYTFHSA
jgi:hypothetical protein